MNELSVKDTLSVAWNTFKENWLSAISAYIIAFGIPVAVLVIALGSTSGSFNLDQLSDEVIITVLPHFTVISIFGLLLYFLLIAYFMGGLVKHLIALYDRQESSLRTIFTNGQFTLRYIGLGFLLSVLVTVGFILLIVPGIYLLLLFAFSYIILVDQNTGIIAAMKKSKALTDGVKLRLLGLFSVVGAISLVLGVIPILNLIMWLVTGPFFIFVVIHAYRVQLARQEGTLDMSSDNLQEPAVDTTNSNIDQKNEDEAASDKKAAASSSAIDPWDQMNSH